MADSVLWYEENQVTIKQKLQEQQEQSLKPFKEDLADWFGKHLGVDITADNFMNVLDNGVYVCKMAKLITQKAEECVKDGSYSNPLPPHKLKNCDENAQSGSFVARDNTANFLSWCKAYGMVDGRMFETEYLVSHKNEKSVITCLLELARIGCKFGLEPPSLIKMEKEMDKEEPVPPTMEKEEPEPSKPTPHKPISLDEEVKKIASLCECQTNVKKIEEGKYLIFKKVIPIRLLRKRYLMVRVGGGWNTLEHYLKTHRPIQVFTHQRPFSASNNDVGREYLYFKSEYKNTKK